MKHLLLIASFVALSGCYWQRQDTIATVAGDTQWQLVEVNDEPVDYSAIVTFPAKNRIAGQAPCNSFSGKQTAPLPWFLVEDIASTRRACLHMNGEAEFFAALNAMRFAEASDGVLLLTGENDQSMTFKAVAAPAS